MKESGTILKKIDSYISEVEIRASSACARCGVCHFNKAGALSMEAKNDIGASVGDVVEVEVPESQVIWASLLIFIFPIFAFFVGYIIKGLFLGVIFLIIYLIFLFLYDKKTKTVPRITRVLSRR